MGTGTSDSTTRFRFALPPESKGFDATGLPKIEEQEYGRVVVLLGANGSGKSRLLRGLASAPTINGKPRPVVYVEGGRAILFPDAIDVGINPEDFKQTSDLKSRLQLLLAILEIERHEFVSEYSALLYKWAEKMDGPKPEEKVSRLKRINDVFSRLLPRRAFSMTPKHRTPLTDKRALRLRNWYLDNNGVSYDIGTISDGEKQVLCLLGDVSELSPPGALIIVDEPELNLHPGLAMNLWNEIERRKSDALFVYATHSISFAMRPNVTDILVLGDSQQTPVHLTDLRSSTNVDWEPFLGAIPAFISSQRVLAVEGQGDKSFDKEFYQWVVGSDITVVNVGSCDRVKSAMNHEGVWEKVGSVRVCGIVDRDYRTETRLSDFETSGCHVLKCHEAESYLCDPELLRDAAKLSGHQRTAEDFIDRMASICESRITPVALKRTIAKSEIRLAVGKEKGESWPKDRDAGKAILDKWISDEIVRANNFEANTQQAYAAEYELCQRAVAGRDVTAMLAIFPGKEMLPALAQLAGFTSKEVLLKSVADNLSPTSYNRLVEVREAVRAALA